MTVEQWAGNQTGIVLKVPKGTVLGHDWEYQHPQGHWIRGTVPQLKAQGLDWQSDTPKRYVEIKTQVDKYVELKIGAGLLEAMALKACHNRSGRSTDGPLTVKRVTGATRS